jgi:hypothetical protein
MHAAIAASAAECLQVHTVPTYKERGTLVKDFNDFLLATTDVQAQALDLLCKQGGQSLLLR